MADFAYNITLPIISGMRNVQLETLDLSPPFYRECMRFTFHYDVDAFQMANMLRNHLDEDLDEQNGEFDPEIIIRVKRELNKTDKWINKWRSIAYSMGLRLNDNWQTAPIPGASHEKKIKVALFQAAQITPLVLLQETAPFAPPRLPHAIFIDCSFNPRFQLPGMDYIRANSKILVARNTRQQVRLAEMRRQVPQIIIIPSPSVSPLMPIISLRSGRGIIQ